MESEFDDVTKCTNHLLRPSQFAHTPTEEPQKNYFLMQILSLTHNVCRQFIADFFLSPNNQLNFAA